MASYRQLPCRLCTDIGLHGVVYSATMEATEEMLSLQIEEKYDVNAWKADFTSKYIEDICGKTPKPLQFPQFISYLHQALSKAPSVEEGSVFLDFLRPQDLELLRGGRAGSS